MNENENKKETASGAKPDTAEQFENALRCVKRSKKYGRFRVHKYKNGRVSLFELADKTTGRNDVRVEFGCIGDVAEILASEYKGKP